MSNAADIARKAGDNRDDLVIKYRKLCEEQAREIEQWRRDKDGLMRQHALEIERLKSAGAPEK